MGKVGSTARLLVAVALAAPGCGLLAGLGDFTDARPDAGSGGGSSSSGSSGGSSSPSATAASVGGGGAGGATSSSSTGTGATTSSSSTGGGPCQGPAGTTALACGEKKPSALAVDAGHVYWAAEDEGAVKRVPIAGGAVEVLIGGLDRPCGLALGDGAVFYRTRGGVVGRVPAGGGAPTDIATQEGEGCAIGVDAANVYWTRVGPPNELRRAPLAGGVSTVFESPYAALQLNASDGTYVVWSDWSGSVMSDPKTQGLVTALGPHATACGLAVSGGFAYWSSPIANAPVLRAPLDGSSASSMLFSGEDEPCFVTVAGAHAIWANLGTNTVRRGPKGGGPVDDLATDPDGPCAIASDGANVFWSTCGPEGRIVELSLP